MNMRNFIFIFSVLFSVNISAQTINTNLRVAKDSKGELVALLDYRITANDYSIEFNCLNCEIDFTMYFIDTLYVKEASDYTIVAMSTDEYDHILLFYKANTLHSVCIQQVNGVSLIYMKSQIEYKSKEVSYKL